MESDPEIIIHWIRNDPRRWQILEAAAQFNLPDWCLAAGFVRNLVWDKLHQYDRNTPLTDIDLIYFNPEDVTETADKNIEKQLYNLLPAPWSVKNQARMHLKHSHDPYQNIEDAMRYWVEIETAVGVRLIDNNLYLIAPYGTTSLLSGELTFNTLSNINVFKHRIEQKQWLIHWPQLEVNLRSNSNQ